MTTPDPRTAVAYVFAWNVSDWPERLQRHLLGRPVPFEFVDRLLAAVDGVDPLRQADTVPVDRQALRRLLDADTQTDIADALDHLVDPLARPHLEQQ